LTLSGIWLTEGTAFDLGVGGLGLALSLGVGIEITILLLILQNRWDWSVRETLGGTFARTLLASATMAVAILAIDAMWNAAVPDGGTLMTLMRVTLLVGGGVAVFAGAATLLGMNEIWDFVRVVLRRKQASELVEEAMA
ncbi:MAG: hypothetical protein AAF125_23330, partial [Chloroflexota bacterium]